jgi:WD40 repeat protein
MQRYATAGKLGNFEQTRFTGHTDAVWDLHVHNESSSQLLFSAAADGLVKAWKVVAVLFGEIRVRH